MSRGLMSSAKNPPSIIQNSRKRITFGDDEPSNFQQTGVGAAFNPSFQSLLFDNTNSNNAQSSRGSLSRTTSFAKEEHDSPRNGVRKDVKLISDAAEPEELFGKLLKNYWSISWGGFKNYKFRDSCQGLRLWPRFMCSHHSLSSC